MKNQTLDISGAELLDSDVYSSFNGGDLMEDFRGGDYFDVTGEKKSNYVSTQADFTDEMFAEYEKSGSKKKFKDWLESDSSKALYEKSDKKKPFKDWLNQDSTKNLLAGIANIGSAFIQGKNITNQTTDNSVSTSSDGGAKKNEEKKILGMTPVTFGVVVSIFSLAVIGSIIIYMKVKK